MVRKWWCQIELKFEVCEFCLRKMLQMTEVKNPDEKMKEMKVWQFYVRSSLLIVFQSFFGFVRFDDKRVEL